MRKKLLRAFQRADDVLEYCLVLGARRIRRSWLPSAAFLMVAAGMAFTPSSRPPAPAHESLAALPSLELPDPALVLPGELDLIDEELALWDAQVDLELEPPNLLDLQLSIGVELTSTSFEVVKVEHGPAGERARILYNGVPHEVREGSIVPSVDTPAFVITDIGDERILALDVWSHRMLDREVPPEALTFPAVKVVAIAGETPDFVAVLEYNRETYIVQSGSRFPEEGEPRFAVSHLFADRVVYTILRSGESRVAHLERPLPVGDLPDIPDIEIPEITP